MTDAPERIWAWPEREWTDMTEVGHRIGPNEPGAEYIRIDLAQQWQPIETAPKDGTRILLWEPPRFFYLGEFVETLNGEWWVEGGQITANPTHWMLPEPPK